MLPGLDAVPSTPVEERVGEMFEEDEPEIQYQYRSLLLKYHKSFFQAPISNLLVNQHENRGKPDGVFPPKI
jgi:hypothetical protein